MFKRDTSLTILLHIASTHLLILTFFEDIPYFSNSDVPTTNLDQVLYIPYFESVESTHVSSSPPVMIDVSS